MVVDDGCGIHPDNFEGVALKHHTSKLSDFTDLLSVSTFGFRGEAVNALCEISGDVSIVTRHESQDIGATLRFNRMGRYAVASILCSDHQDVECTVLLLKHCVHAL